MKTFVRFASNSIDGDFVKDETGYIDGYVFNGKHPLVVVITGNRVVFSYFHQLEVLTS